LVNAYHIGLHKTATTWLQQIYFSQHPQLHLLNDWNNPWDDAFLNYLVVTPVKKFDPTIAKRILEKRVNDNLKCGGDQKIIISAERLSGHPYSGGCDRYQIGERIKKISPGAKILLFVRDQVPMLKSLYKQMVNQGYTGSIRDFIYGKTWIKKGFQLSYLEYDILAKFYIETFGKKNILLSRFEDFQKDQKEVLFKICEFLQITKWTPNESLTIKLGKRTTEKNIPVLRFLNKFQKSEYVDSPVFILHKNIIEMIFKSTKFLNIDTSIDDEDQQFLQNYYRLSNGRLRELFNEEYMAL